MISVKERACIESAAQIRIEKLLAVVNALSAVNIIKKSPLRFVFDVDKPCSNSPRTKLEVVILPFMLALKLFIVITFPLYFLLVYMLNSLDKKRLKDEIKSIENMAFVTYSVECKSLESLWCMYGLDRNEYSDDRKLVLLKNWIEILYGRLVLDSLSLDELYKSMSSTESRTNAAGFSELGFDRPTFTLMNPIDSLIRRLSDELPVYG